MAVALLAVLAGGCGSSGGDDTSEADGGAPADETTTTQSAETTTTRTPVEEGPEPTCAYAGTDPTLGYMQVELTFTNSLGDVNGLELTFALLDGEGGTRFFTGTAGGFDMEDIHFPEANEEFRLSVDTREGLPSNIEPAGIACTVLAIEEATDIGGYKRAAEADTCEVLGADSSGNIQVELSVTSPYEEATDVQTWWALQGPGQVRFETSTEVVDLVGAGETFRIIPEYGAEKPDWVGDGEVTCAVVGFWDQGR